LTFGGSIISPASRLRGASRVHGGCMNANLQDTGLEHNKSFTNVIYALYACTLITLVTFFVAIVMN